MALFRRKNSTKGSSPLLRSPQPTQSPQTIESSLHQETSPRESLHLPSAAAQDPPPRETQGEQVHEQRGREETQRTETGSPPEGLLDKSLVGRKIKLAQAENWQQDIIPTLDLETEILYENQRGMFLFGRPYFSGNSLIHIFKFDPPPYQTTSSFLTSSPGPIDPSNPHNDPLHTLKEINEKGGKGKWPPDALRLYYSPFSPYDPFLSLDSRRGQSFMWRQDRWYVDMRGDVDQEGWEYAFYWNGRWRWCGGNWHGQARLVHAWVRRRKWIRELIRKNVSPAQKPRDKEEDHETGKEEEQIGKISGGGLDELIQLMRSIPSPNLRRKRLSNFLDAALPSTLAKFPDYIHQLYMILDPLSITTLVKCLQRLKTTASSSPDIDKSAGLEDALSHTLEYLYSKREGFVMRPGKLDNLPSRLEMQWESHYPRKSHFPTRRERIRPLRKQWWETRTSPSILIRRVRFAEEGGDEEAFYMAPEGSSARESRTGSMDSSREEWFVAPEEVGKEIVPAKSVGGLIREGMRMEREREGGGEVAVVDT